MSEKQQEMMEYTTQDLVAYLMEDLSVPMEEAMDQVYGSSTFRKLRDPETGLYMEGAAYVYELLKAEQA